ncbi:MAG: small conductance mechanosensitive channel [Oceanicoccus sp.]|jgi:small conductance mechanosensitive channel
MNEVIDKLPEALLVLFFFYVASRFLDGVLRKFASHFDMATSEVFSLLSNSQRSLFLLIAVIMAIGTLGFDISVLVAGLGLSGFALSFALKDAISNLIAGIMIVIYKPCEMGDLIEVSGSKGKIIDINLRYLTINTDAGKCLLPNSLIINNKMTIFKTDTDTDTEK